LQRAPLFVVAIASGPRFRHTISRKKADIAQRTREVWRRNTGRPLRIEAGTTWIAGIVALDAKNQPSFVPRGDYNLAPYIDQHRIEQEGMLAFWEEGDRDIPDRAHMNRLSFVYDPQGR
jgi:hypothetical protein